MQRIIWTLPRFHLPVSLFSVLKVVKTICIKEALFPIIFFLIKYTSSFSSRETKRKDVCPLSHRNLSATNTVGLTKMFDPLI